VRKVAIVFLIIGAAVALQAMVSVASLATDGGELEEPTRQAGEDRWVPSLAITSGVTIQQQQGFADSFFEDTSPTVPIRGFVKGNDTAVSPFVGGSLELMTPALPITTRPRLFVSGEILPTFASDRDLAVEGDPSCIRGPEPNAPCAKKPGGLSGTAFNADNANGQGSSLETQVDTLVFGANLGVAFPVEVLERQLRIKPSVAWINYKVEADGLVVDAACGDPNAIPPSTRCNDFLREMTLAASDSQRFNGIGPGVDVEMDAGQLGPLGVSLFLGGRAYAIVGDRDMSFSDTKSYDDRLGTDDATALFKVKVDPWMFRAHVGIRFHYLGNQD
jgi:hypothetical protein